MLVMKAFNVSGRNTNICEEIPHCYLNALSVFSTQKDTTEKGG